MPSTNSPQRRLRLSPVTVPDFLSEGWFAAFAAALKKLPAEQVAADAPAGGLALGQIVTGVPDEAGAARTQNDEVRYTIVLRQDGSASLVRNSIEPADVILVEDWSTAAIHQLTHEAVLSSESDRARLGRLIQVHHPAAPVSRKADPVFLWSCPEAE